VWSNQQASSTGWAVTVHIVFKNHLDPTGRKGGAGGIRADVTRNFDSSAQTTITEAEPH